MSSAAIWDTIRELRANAASARRVAFTFKRSAVVKDLQNFAVALETDAKAMEAVSGIETLVYRRQLGRA